MLFSDEGKKIKELEARLKKLERITERNFEQIDYSFKLFKDILIRLHTEKDLLEKEKEALKKELEEIEIKIKDNTEIPISRVHEGVKERFIRPVKKSFEDDIELIRKITKIEAEDEKK